MTFKIKNKLSKLEGLPCLKRWSPPSSLVPSSEELEGFRKSQKLAFQCCLDIEKEIRVGWTEKQVSLLMNSYLKDFGVRSFFHKSFVWFGSRTRYEGITNFSSFMPGSYRLSEGDVIILDTAPIVEGFASDVSTTFSMNPNDGLKEAKKVLGFLRNEIPNLFESSMTPSEILTWVGQRLIERGYDNCHPRFSSGVLGHKVYKIPLWKIPAHVGPFSIQSYWAFLSRGIFSEILSPDYEGTKLGLWAIEPHLGGEGFGAKFEEILVVKKEKVFWLDEDVPHNQIL